MKIELLERAARIPIEEFITPIEEQWRQTGAITDEEKIIPSVNCEQGRWYLFLRIAKASRIIRLDQVKKK